MTLHPPRATLFPYTTLFRSMDHGRHELHGVPLQRRGQQWVGEVAQRREGARGAQIRVVPLALQVSGDLPGLARSEEHTSELQSHSDLVCRLLLEKKNT